MRWGWFKYWSDPFRHFAQPYWTFTDEYGTREIWNVGWGYNWCVTGPARENGSALGRRGRSYRVGDAIADTAVAAILLDAR